MNEIISLYDRFEVNFEGPDGGNPFIDINLSAEFTCQNRTLFTEGFYDGNGVYKVRIMPDAVGNWSYVIHSNCPVLDGKKGSFVCVSRESGNHGPVRVTSAPINFGSMVLRETSRFSYADGTPYSCIGTTSYAWINQPEKLQNQTLETLKNAPFNKIRMCVFPKHYDYNHNDPIEYPFVGNRETGFDFTRFNTHFFWNLEKRITQLADLGIEADLILFHPYDNWGFANMPHEVDIRYLRYIIARLSSFHNVWWSLANEWDMMEKKTVADWDDFFQTIQQFDPSQHLRSIHQFQNLYDHSKNWVTHVSYQGSNITQIDSMISKYRKPVIFDECGYEGSIPHPWGNLSAQELIYRMWEGFVRGGYVGHGEVFENPEEIYWWSKGGKLYGESSRRIAFLKNVIENIPKIPQYSHSSLGTMYPSLSVENEYYLFYTGRSQPAHFPLQLPDGEYSIEILDTWECTFNQVDGTFSGNCSIKLPQKPYIAIRVVKN